jgi:hypothetical protein
MINNCKLIILFFNRVSFCSWNPPQDFKNHIKTVHEAGKQFKCTICEKCFTLKETLVAHIDSHDRKRDEEQSELEKNAKGEFRDQGGGESHGQPDHDDE